jgi:undecaprenyl diphosphate synthase
VQSERTTKLGFNGGTLAFDKPFDEQAALIRLETWQNATERKPPAKGTATSLLQRFLYWLYERLLLDQLKGRPMPRHIGIILDGNRRHARKRGLSDPCEIYQRGAEKLDDILDWCADLRIPALTLWVFSTENLKRTQAEVSGILSAIEAKIAALAHDPFMHQKRVRIQAIGRLDLLPESVVTAIRAAETATAQYDLMTLTIAVGYGGREEIADAVRSFIKTQAREEGVVVRCDRAYHTRGHSLPSLCSGPARSRLDHQNERRNPLVRFPSLAERAQ